MQVRILPLEFMKYRVPYKGISSKDGQVASDMLIEASSIDDAIAKVEKKLSKKKHKGKKEFSDFCVAEFGIKEVGLKAYFKL